MISNLLIIVVAILTIFGFIASALRIFGNRKNKLLTLELVILFLGLSYSLWQLSYFSILIATIGALGVLVETKNK
ncbi:MULTISPECIES: hypothetical protein [Leuconostoc]|uniref:Uncharacterized protein n=2 Tax=Leuconostoc kimchii TaxID=136609 RepID=D5T3D6_LEUKI|nr:MULTISPECIES: hypothetical protein [Leuconostoc]ADG40785.1 hypothetical protein LKI_06225 [Leuconostoc kimchii IMSNU 11154]AEJ31239.1 hypothetical protein LGMK_05910 [Leuconostoc sp. C2]QBR48325.1 hypothetical protein EW139_09455 [Leuconostoc kimchii]